MKIQKPRSEFENDRIFLPDLKIHEPEGRDSGLLDAEGRRLQHTIQIGFIDNHASKPRRK